LSEGRSPFYEPGRDAYPKWSPNQEWEEPAVMPHRAEGGEVEDALRVARSYEPALRDLPKQEPELKEYRPSLKERIAAALMGEERPSPERRNFAEGLSELAYYVPGIGEAIAGDRLGRSIATEDYLTALKTALGVIPGTGKLVTDRLPKTFGGQAYANDMAMVGAKKGGRINTKIDRDPDWDMGLAAGGEVENALRLARKRFGEGGVPDERAQEEFLRKELEGSAPQYTPDEGANTAKEIGRVLASLTTPGAVADASGYLGSPSIAKNLSEGDYTDAALQLAGTIPVAGPLVKGATAAKLASFIAPRNSKALEIARQAVDAGYSREDIFHDLGLFQGTDKNWRERIDDRGARLKPKAMGELNRTGSTKGNLEYIFDAPELFEAIPNLKGIYTSVSARPDKKLGAGYDPIRNALNVSTKGIDDSAIGPRALLLHELQHAIQNQAKFSPGQNPDLLGIENYLRSAGENEARRTQIMRNLSNETIRNNPEIYPWKPLAAPKEMQESERIYPEHEQIVY
jgi:hypothetical protein